MSMDRLPGSGVPNLPNYQIGQQIVNPQQQPNQQPQGPVMRQARTGREDDEWGKEKINNQQEDSSSIMQHSDPHVSPRHRPNQASLQLDLIDQERFVYTRKNFDEALAAEDSKALVRMLRHGTLQRSDKLLIDDAFDIVKDLLCLNKPKLMAELVRESAVISQGFLIICADFFTVDTYEKVSDFVLAVNENRELTNEVKDSLFCSWFKVALDSGDPEFFDRLVRKERQFFQDEGHAGYGNIFNAAAYKKTLCEPFVKIFFTDDFIVKPRIDAKVCAVAAGVAAAIGCLEWSIKLQDKVLANEDVIKKWETAVTDQSLGNMMKNGAPVQFMDRLATYIKYLEHKGGSPDIRLTATMNLCATDSLRNSASYNQTIALLTLQRSLIEECIRPRLAEAIARKYQECFLVLMDQSQFEASDESSDDSDENDQIQVEVNKKMLQALLASQWESLELDDETADELTAIQASSLATVGKAYINKIIGTVPELIDQCFEFVDVEQSLDTDEIQQYLVNEYSFPKSLAKFLAQSMSAAVAEQTNKPAALPQGILNKEVGKYLQQVVKQTACNEFKNKLGNLLKQQELITLFNKDAEGRDELWHNYFYTYLDVLKESLPSLNTRH